jgi:hypothetical protein
VTPDPDVVDFAASNAENNVTSNSQESRLQQAARNQADASHEIAQENRQRSEKTARLKAQRLAKEASERAQGSGAQKKS